MSPNLWPTWSTSSRRICVPGGCRQTLARSTTSHPRCKGSSPALSSVIALPLALAPSPAVAPSSSPSLGPHSSSPSIPVGARPIPPLAFALPCLPRVEDIFATDIPTLKSIPLCIRNLCFATLSRVFRSCVSSGPSLGPWTLLFLFPKAVLRWSAKRGGDEAW